MASSFLRFLDHTQRGTTLTSTLLDESSDRRRDLYLTKHNTQNIHAPGRFRTRNLSRRAAGKLPSRLRGDRDRLWRNILTAIILNTKPLSSDNLMPSYHKRTRCHKRKTTLYIWMVFPFLFLSLKTHFVTSPSCRSYKHDVNCLWISATQFHSHIPISNIQHKRRLGLT